MLLCGCFEVHCGFLGRLFGLDLFLGCLAESLLSVFVGVLGIESVPALAAFVELGVSGPVLPSVFAVAALVAVFAVPAGVSVLAFFPALVAVSAFGTLFPCLVLALSFAEVALCGLAEVLLLVFEIVHLHVLVAGDLVAETFHKLLGREFLDLVCTGRTGDEIDLGCLEEFSENELSSSVTVCECGGDPLSGKVLDCLGDVGSLDSDTVLDTCPEQVENIRSALDNDNRFRILDSGSCGAPVLSVGGDLFDLDRLPDVLSKVRGCSFGLCDEFVEKLFCTLDDLLPLCDTDIFDTEHADGCFAGSDAVDGLECRCENDRLDLIE